MHLQEHITAQSQEISDGVLLEQILEGDNRAFETLVRRYHTPLFHFIHYRLGDYEQTRDVLQHVFFQLYLSTPKLSANFSTLHTKEPLKSWLFQVALNRCIDERRKKRPILFSELELDEKESEWSVLEMLSDPHPLPEEVVEHSDLQCSLHQAIEDLPPKFRLIVLLRYTKELTFVEIGRLLHIPENTAKSYFQRARPLLRNALTAQAQLIPS